MAFGGLVQRKETWVLTRRGALALLAVCTAGVLFAARQIHPFLAITEPLGGDVLVVEGWMPDVALQEALGWFEQHPYRLLVTTGGPLEKGSYLSAYSTTAELAAATLRRLGADPDRIVAVPAPAVRADRTFESALALGRWLSGSGLAAGSLDVVSLGAHARRTRLLFQKALGDRVRVGVIAAANPGYDEEHWWAWSGGVRAVVGETTAYLYARFLFREPAPQPVPQGRCQAPAAPPLTGPDRTAAGTGMPGPDPLFPLSRRRGRAAVQPVFSRTRPG